MEQVTESDIIKKVRLAQDMSLRDFADKIGVSHNAVAQWENGKSAVDLDRVTDWLSDEREWVRNMAVSLLGCKVGPAFDLVLANYKPIGTQSGTA